MPNHWHDHARKYTERGDFTAAFLVLFEAVINLENRMADDVQKLTDDIAALQQAEADTKTRVSAAVAALQAQIDDLKAHPASPDLSAQIAALEATTADLATIAPAAPPTT